jgi:hypothetical protein
MSAMASAMSSALGRSEAKRDEEPQIRPEKSMETVVEKPVRDRAKPEGEVKPKAAPVAKADGEFVSGPMVERAQKSASAWMARTGSSAKDLALRVGWSNSHIEQLLAGRKKYIPAGVAAALIALDREK